MKAFVWNKVIIRKVKPFVWNKFVIRKVKAFVFRLCQSEIVLSHLYLGYAIWHLFHHYIIKKMPFGVCFPTFVNSLRRFQHPIWTKVQIESCIYNMTIVICSFTFVFEYANCRLFYCYWNYNMLITDCFIALVFRICQSPTALLLLILENAYQRLFYRFCI